MRGQQARSTSWTGTQDQSPSGAFERSASLTIMAIDNRWNRVRALADVLRGWAEQVEAGITVPRTVEAQGARAVAATDLMQQVRALNEDTSVHPAAPIVLAGAALEVALRSAVDEVGLVLNERPSISAYTRGLRADGLLTAQDVKDVGQMGGIRNAAAHGDFEELSRERSGLLEQQVNLFLRRLSDLLEGTTLAG